MFYKDLSREILFVTKSVQGDSGGPLVVLKRDTNEGERCKHPIQYHTIPETTKLDDVEQILKLFSDRYFLVGVVSFGYKCAEPVRITLFRLRIIQIENYLTS